MFSQGVTWRGVEYSCTRLYYRSILAAFKLMKLKIWTRDHVLEGWRT